MAGAEMEMPADAVVETLASFLLGRLVDSSQKFGTPAESRHQYLVHSSVLPELTTVDSLDFADPVAKTDAPLRQRYEGPANSWITPLAVVVAATAPLEASRLTRNQQRNQRMYSQCCYSVARFRA